MKRLFVFPVLLALFHTVAFGEERLATCRSIEREATAKIIAHFAKANPKTESDIRALIHKIEDAYLKLVPKDCSVLLANACASDVFCPLGNEIEDIDESRYEAGLVRAVTWVIRNLSNIGPSLMEATMNRLRVELGSDENR